MSKLMPDGTRATVVVCNDCGNSFPCKVVIRTAGELAMKPYLCLFGMNRSKGRKCDYKEIPIEEYEGGIHGR